MPEREEWAAWLAFIRKAAAADGYFAFAARLRVGSPALARVGWRADDPSPPSADFCLAARLAF
ncbi:MAG TPA: hypothetical protein VMT89_16455, partial [Candidatus Acidoferrales bacterium]|nr:hypothetical protein [Candidatus Acidoferrales bacterium]